MNEMWIRKPGQAAKDRVTVHTKGEVTYLSFPLLDELSYILHGVSTRLGGVSCGDEGTMNLSFSREPNRENVLENHRRLADAIGYRMEDVVFSDQTHTANVMVVSEVHKGCGLIKSKPYHDIDGLVTNVPGVPLMTFYADCVPLLIVDPVHRAIGCAHSGWKGTAANIASATLDTMQKEYDTCPEDVIAAIGPSICQDCYEVSADVAERFREVYPADIWEQLCEKKPDGKYQLDLWKACRQNFLRAGVLPENISLPDVCTCCNPKLLFSHRASRGRRGNLAAVLMLKKSV